MSTKILSAALLLGSLTPCRAAVAVESAVKEEAPLTFILTEELKAKMSGPASRWNFVLIDARTRTEFDESRIDGAVNVPAEKIKSDLPKLVADKSRQLVFYCNGPKCTKSQKAARTALAMGYSNILEYNQGLPAWKEHKFPVAGTPMADFEPYAVNAANLDKELKDPKTAPLLVDVRPLDEFAKFSIPGSVNVPLDDVKARVKELPRKPIVILDHAGHQGLIAGRLLNSLGRGKDLRRLGGGLMKWKEAGLPLQGTEAQAAVSAK